MNTAFLNMIAKKWQKAAKAAGGKNDRINKRESFYKEAFMDTEAMRKAIQKEMETADEKTVRLIYFFLQGTKKPG